MAKTRIKLVNIKEVEEEPEAVIIRFPVELRELKKTTQKYEGIPSFNLSVYRNIREREYKERLGETA